MTHVQGNSQATRKFFRSGKLTLSYLDFGGEGKNVLLLLHGHMNDARTYADLAAKFADWHVIGLDQRGHGWSEHPLAAEYRRENYIDDIRALIETELGGQPVTIIGHSLGGLNAYQFAARYPEYVNAVIVEDIGAEIKADLSFVEQLPERSASMQELRAALARVGVRAIDYFAESVFADEQGWGFRTDLNGMNRSQQNANGSWWDDWLASTCPILLIHGKKSFVLGEAHAEQMAARRPNTSRVAFDCGHGVHSDEPERFYQAARAFLNELQEKQAAD